MTNTERLIDLLKDLTDSEMIAIHNEYCEVNKYYGDRIYYMYELDELAQGLSALDIIADYGDIAVSMDYFQENEVFKTHTCFNYYEDAETTYYKEIAEYCINNNNYLWDWNIRDFLEEINEENED